MNVFRFSHRPLFHVWILGIAACSGLAGFAGGAARAESIDVTSYDGNTLTQYDLATGAPTVLFASFSTSSPTIPNTILNKPDGIAISPVDGSIYVSNGGTTPNIVHFSSTGTYLGTVVFSGTGFTPFGAPAGLRFGPNGDLFVSDNFGSAIQEFSVTGNNATYVGSPISGLFAGGGITFGPSSPGTSGPNNTLYAGDFVSGAVVAGGNTTYVPGTFSSNPSGLLFLPNGNLLASNLFGNDILEYSPGVTGTLLATPFTTFPGFPTGPSYSPADLRIDPATGNVIVDVLGTSQTSPTGSIVEFEPDGTPVSLPAGFSNLLSPSDFDFVPDAIVPEPSSVVAVIGLGCMGLIGLVRRRRRTAHCAA